MAHPPPVRARALELYLAGWSYRRITLELGVAKSTLIEWSKADEWNALRAKQRELQRVSADLVLELARAARETRDPQQAYAAMTAARLAGLAEPAPAERPPSAAEVAELLLRVLDEDVEFGPLVRRRRREIVSRVADAAERLMKDRQ